MCMCVWVPCQLPPRGEPGNTLSALTVWLNADSRFYESCGVVQIIEGLTCLDLVNLGDH